MIDRRSVVTGINEREEARADAGETLEQLSRAARALRADGSAAAGTLTAIVTQATETVPPAAWSGLIELEHGRLVPRATYGEPPRVLDHWQQKSGTGPCIEAAREQAVVVIDDAGADARWPEFGSLAGQEGVSSMLCVPLWVDRRRLGTLSLYGRATYAFGESERRVAALYATLAALALADGQRVANLTLALDSRDLIGQAKGILIERLRITADAAFHLLSETSQNTNRKLAAVAEHLVNTGELPI
jgi:GAF domain-containing protein